jgi:hypothetical protein
MFCVSIAYIATLYLAPTQHLNPIIIFLQSGSLYQKAKFHQLTYLGTVTGLPSSLFKTTSTIISKTKSTSSPVIKVRVQLQSRMPNLSAAAPTLDAHLY